MKINELLTEGWGADEITPFANGFTIWHKKQSAVRGEGNYWVYKTPKEFSDWDDSMKWDLESTIKKSEPIAKAMSHQQALDIMKKAASGETESLEENPLLYGTAAAAFNALRALTKFKHLPDETIKKMSHEVVKKQNNPDKKPNPTAKDQYKTDQKSLDDEQFKQKYGWDKTAEKGGLDDTLEDLTPQEKMNKMSDIDAKKKALQDIQTDPHTDKDPELKKELVRRKAELDAEIERLLDLAGVQESATAGATSSGNIATVVNPQLSPGTARGKKSYTGDPWGGKSGTKSPPQPKPKQPKAKNGTAKNALDMKNSIFGENPIRR